jgi:hypothetical protein
MSDESSGSGLKNAIIGLVTIVVTAIAGVVGKKVMGDDEAPAAAAVAAPAPVINLNVENNNTMKGGSGGGSAAPAPAAKPAPKKDDWTKAEPKW